MLMIAQPRRGCCEPGDLTDSELAGQVYWVAVRVIIEAAREAKAELIVLAARPGRTAVPGTVSQYVLLKARYPVAVVPVEDTDERPPD